LSNSFIKRTIPGPNFPAGAAVYLLAARSQVLLRILSEAAISVRVELETLAIHEPDKFDAVNVPGTVSIFESMYATWDAPVKKTWALGDT
jgi:hypothetical protein